MQDGTTLVEVLVAMVILAVGLLGLVGLQGRLQLLQMESYQRAQALMLLHDMASRLALNRNDAANYVTTAAAGTTGLGVGMTCPTTTATRQQADASEWCAALQGAGETFGGTNVGAMVGARGCIQRLGLPGANPNPGEYLVTVAWQGLGPVSAPPAGVSCGANLYGGAGTPCEGDLCRRVVTTVVRIGNLATT